MLYELLSPKEKRQLQLSIAAFTATWFLAGELLALTMTPLVVHALGCGAYQSPIALYFIVTVFYLSMGGITLTYYSMKSFTRLWFKLFGPRDRPGYAPRIYPRVSVIVPVYNGERTLGRVLRALLSQDYPRELMEIIIVDDGSTDDTPLIVEYYRRLDTRIRYLRHKVNRGKAAALAEGIAAATGDVILILDDDTIPEKNAIARLVSTLALEHNIGAASGAIAPAGGSGVLYWLQRIEYLMAFQIGRFFDEATSGTNMILSGAFSAFRAPLVKSIFLNPRNRLDRTIAEDFDLSIRVWKRGLRTAYCDNALAYTAVPSILRSLYHQRIRWFTGGLQVLLQHLRLFRYRKRHAARRIARRLIPHFLVVEYVLPILQVVGIAAVFAVLAAQLLGAEILPIPLCVFIAAFLSTYITIVVMSTATVVSSFAIVHGARVAARILPYAVLYSLFYLPLLSIAKTDATIRALQRIKVQW
jgi:biofilm PGA synthesis N-glycosyltransferase PgaC